MPETRDGLFSIAIFPYLKTSGPVQFGPYLFRSTDDLEGLNNAQVTAVTEVTAMLYTRFHLKPPAGRGTRQPVLDDRPSALHEMLLEQPL